MPKKKIDAENENTELEIKENIVEKKEPKKKAYKVVLVAKHLVIYRVSDGTNSSTVNIWGEELKPGDDIYLEE